MAHVNIAAPRHCDYIIEWLTEIFDSAGISTIRYKDPADMPNPEPGRTHNLVIAAQVYSRLPSRYSTFQVEQLTSARWLNESYINALSRSEYILDYSVHNLNILRNLGLEERRFFYCPIGIKKEGAKTAGWEDKDISFLFYGDPSSPRRKRILDKLSEHIPITICSEVFGEEVEIQVRRSKYVLNIHFYEKALLETTRICQSLSLGTKVITESAINDDEYHGLYGNGLMKLDLDQQSSHRALQRLIDDPLTLKRDKPTNEGSPVYDRVPNCHSQNSQQAYHVARFLLELSLIDYNTFKRLALESIDPKSLAKGTVLTLPESTRYTEAKKLATKLDLALFHGVKYNPGWRGCGLSYKLMGEACEFFNISSLTCLEDDCKIDTNAYAILKKLRSKAKALEEIDLTSGIISDISRSSVVSLPEMKLGSRSLVVKTNRVTSMLCNIYEHKCLGLMANWPLESGIGSMLTIDRWLEIHNLACVTTYPYLADQANNLASTIWGNHNSMQGKMIKRSEEGIAKMALDIILNKLHIEEHIIESKDSNADKDVLFILERLRELFENYPIYSRSEERLPISTLNHLNEQPISTANRANDQTAIGETRTWRAITKLKLMIPGYFFFRRLAIKLYRSI